MENTNDRYRNKIKPDDLAKAMLAGFEANQGNNKLKQ